MILGRLAKNATLESARTELETISRRLDGNVLHFVLAAASSCETRLHQVFSHFVWP